MIILQAVSVRPNLINTIHHAAHSIHLTQRVDVSRALRYGVVLLDVIIFAIPHIT